MEALIRWRHPQRGLVAPNQFIPIAEDLGLIIPIGKWVLYRACLQAKAWQDLCPQPLVMSVNLSPIQFRDRELLNKIKEVLDQTGFDPRFLQMEITESSLTHDAQVALEVLKSLKDLNILIAIDDFGVGNSSLCTLKNLPVDTLKIDKSFIRSLPDNTNDQAIVHTILSLGKIMDLKIIDEGIETEEQLEFMRQTNCDAYQGYYFSPPLPEAEITQALKHQFQVGASKNMDLTAGTRVLMNHLLCADRRKPQAYPLGSRIPGGHTWTCWPEARHPGQGRNALFRRSPGCPHTRSYRPDLREPGQSRQR